MPDKQVSWTSRPEGQARTAALIWCAFFLAVLLYGMTAFLYRPARSGPDVPSWLVLAVGIAMMAVALLARRLVPRAPASARTKENRNLSRDVAQWALDEAVGVLGLVWRLLGGEWRECAVLLLVSGVLLWLHRPRA